MKYLFVSDWPNLVLKVGEDEVYFKPNRVGDAIEGSRYATAKEELAKGILEQIKRGKLPVKFYDLTSPATEKIIVNKD